MFHSCPLKASSEEHESSLSRGSSGSFLQLPRGYVLRSVRRMTGEALSDPAREAPPLKGRTQHPVSKCRIR